MKNIININAASGSYSVTKESGADAVLVSFKNVTGTENQVELYQGNEYNSTLACRNLEGNAEATLPAEVFTGNNLHFRMIQDGTPGQFYHIIFDPKKAFTFDSLSAVIYSNTKGVGYVITGTGLNTYADLEPFTQEYLDAHNYGTLRGGQL